MLSFLLFFRSRLHFPNLGDAFTYQQKLDHFNSTDTRFFTQYYFYNDSFVNQSQDPKIILYIGGEAPLSPNTVTHGSVIDLARRTQSHLFSLEHRFFGKSQPFDELIPENLQYLTVDQALNDLAGFIGFIKKKHCGNLKCPLLVVGGSYPGTLSSYFRLKFPHLADYSWASSAPVLIHDNPIEYDEFCAIVLNNTSPQCLKNTRNMMMYFQSLISDTSSEEYKQFRAKVGLEKSTDPISALSVVADYVAGITQYNTRFKRLKPYCDTQLGENYDLEAFYEHFHLSLADFGQTADDMDDLLQFNTSAYSDEASGRSWSWMICNEFSWFQPASGLLRPDYVNMTYNERVCQHMFGEGIAKTAKTAIKYGGIDPQSTNIVFTNGNVDPWSHLSVKSDKHSDARYAYYIDGASHCADLGDESESDSEDLKMKRKQIVERLASWMNDECSSTCIHGVCKAQRCVCQEGFYGPNCDRKRISLVMFRLFSSLVVFLPTLMMVIIGSAAWIFFQQDNNEPEIRTIT